MLVGQRCRPSTPTWPLVLVLFPTSPCIILVVPLVLSVCFYTNMFGACLLGRVSGCSWLQGVLGGVGGLPPLLPTSARQWAHGFCSPKKLMTPPCTRTSLFLSLDATLMLGIASGAEATPAPNTHVWTWWSVHLEERWRLQARLTSSKQVLPNHVLLTDGYGVVMDQI